MKKQTVILSLLCCALSSSGQVFLNLDSCRNLAISNNKELLISNERMSAAEYERKAAFTNYLPSVSVAGGYMYNQKELSLLSDGQKEALSSLGTTAEGALGNLVQSSPVIAQALGPVLQELGGSLAPALNGMGQSLVDGLHTDARNIYGGAITVKQPIYMGGKIRAYNKITKYAEELAHRKHNAELQEVILSVDQVYWQCVSLVNKQRLANSYLELLQKMSDDVDKLIVQGLATKAEGLSVRVKRNEAEISLSKVDDGLNLSKMLLCQICGIDIRSQVILADEDVEDFAVTAATIEADYGTALNNRPEIKSLELASAMYKQKINITRSEYMPTVAVVGNYLATNPSLFNGFETKLKGMWNVGVMVQIPLWHWGEGSYKIKAARAEENIANYEYNSAKEKIELQVIQSAFNAAQARKRLTMAENNQERAEENLRYATLGFREGVIAVSNVLEAQTAWISAQAEKIDAQIDVKLTDVYLQKTLGILQ